MRLKENRRLAAAICLVCALVSVFGLGGWKLNAKEDALRDTFVLGTQPELATRHSMDAYLSRAADAAADLAQEAKQYPVDTQLIDSVATNAEALKKGNGMDGREEAYLALTKSVGNLFSALQAAGAGGEVNVKLAYGDFTSAQSLMKYDGYHAAAKAYNKAVGAFPANLISFLWGIDKAETYGW